MSTYNSPFVPGAEVAIFGSYNGSEVTTATVGNVMKSGNFKLTGGDQQWRPSLSSDGIWRASPTGDSYTSRHVQFLDDACRQRIAEVKAATRRRHRIIMIKDAAHKLRLEAKIPDETLTILEVALGIKPPSDH